MLSQVILKKDKIILLKGENGRQLIETELKKKGFKICIIECYKRILKKIDIQKEVKKWLIYRIDTLIATSSEILHELKSIFFKVDKTQWLLKCKIFVVGQRLARIARELGWENIVICQYANNEHLFQTIYQDCFK